MSPDVLKPGARVRVQQTIFGGETLQRARWTSHVEGTIVSCEAEPTSSWYKHGKQHRVWLLRLRLKKDDGEIAALNLDNASVVTVLSHS